MILLFIFIISFVLFMVTFFIWNWLDEGADSRARTYPNNGRMDRAQRISLYVMITIACLFIASFVIFGILAMAGSDAYIQASKRVIDAFS